MSSPRSGLNDAQKGDLAALWGRHAPSTALSQVGGPTEDSFGFGGRSAGNGGRGRGRGGRGRGRGGGGRSGVAPTRVVAMCLEDEDYHMITSVYAFLRSLVDRVEGMAPTKTPEENEVPHFEEGMSQPASKTWESISFLFHRSRVSNSTDANKSIVVPRIVGGKQITVLDHEVFFEEFTAFEQATNGNDQVSFAGYLYRSPDRALASLACAVGIVVLTLWRRHQSYTPNANSLQQHARQHHPHLSIFDTAMYHPRFYNMSPSYRIRMASIRTSAVGRLVSLRGTVTKARPKRLRVLDVGFTCQKCGLHQITRFLDGKYCSPTKCEGIKCRSQKFALNRKVANFSDVQELKIQEIQEELLYDDAQGSGNERDAGRAPRQLEVEVADDLVDTCNAGDSVVVVGTVRTVNSALASGRSGKRASETSTYKMYLVAHSIVNFTADDGLRGKKRVAESYDSRGSKRTKTSFMRNYTNYTDQQLQMIASIAHADHKMYSMPTRMAFPFDLLVRSICPSIIGNDLVKAGILLCLLGGSPPEESGLESQSGMSIRSNSHLLIVGDPGMGKSQMLLAANQVAARSVYVGGNATSSTGLTVSLTKEPGGNLGIEAGALVLSDRGVCCLDELDKMPKKHLDGLLEAMEQQQVSVAKAGIVASLPSRCSVIAAANPKSGTYNLSKSVAENLSMPGPLLSRFDLVFILRDQACIVRDKQIGMALLNQPMDKSRSSGPELAATMEQFGNGRVPLQHRLPWVNDFQKEPLPLQTVKDYIAYAREYCKPKMTDVAAQVLQEYFTNLRRPQNTHDRKSSVPITTRQLEALIRLSQARAKACLRQYVLREDAEDVVELMIESSRQVHTDEAGNLDKGRGGVGGKSKQKRMFIEAMRNSAKGEFSYADLQHIADRLSLPCGGFRDFVDNLRDSGDVLQKSEYGTTFYTLS